MGGAALGASALSTAGLARTVGWASATTVLPSAAKPWVRWWWPGGVVEKNELKREISLLRDSGFGGAEIQAFNPAIPDLTKAERGQLNDYANPAFFDNMQVVADAGLNDGIQIDYTFGSAWPSGGGFAITPELALLELTPAITTITAPVSGPIKVQIPTQTKKFGALGSLDARNRDPRAAGWKERLEKRWRLVAVIAFKGNAPVLRESGKKYRETNVVSPGKIEGTRAIVLTDKVQADGTLSWTPPSDGMWQIVAFKQYTVDSSAMGAVGEGPQLVLDHFNKAAFEAHAERVGAPLAAFGANKKALRAMFVDSLELMTDLYWSEAFLDEFARRRGYDLTPYLHHILQPGWEAPWEPRYSPPYFESGEDTDDRVRSDYHNTVAELLDENFWKPFVQWSHQNGFEARLQAHGGPSYLVSSYGLADIPETEDLGGNGSVHFHRLARAAADIYGKKIVSCESLCWALKAYEITPEQWLGRTNYLFASGVNSLIYHGFPYALHRDAWPGWFPFAPSPFLGGFSSQINEGNPLWAGIPTLNEYVHRAQSLLQRGTNYVPIAVLMTNPGWACDEGDANLEAILTGLLDAGYDYDRLPYSGLDVCTMVNGRLVTAGGAKFEALIIPPLAGISPRAIRQIEAFAQQGLKVVFVDTLPTRSNSLSDAAVSDAAVRKSVAALNVSAVPGSKLTSALLTGGVAPNLQFKSAPCLFLEKRDGAETLLVLHNRKETAEVITASVEAKGYPVRLDLFTGERFAVESKQYGDRIEFSTEIAAGGAAFVVFQSSPGRKKLSRATIKTLPLTQGWNLTAEGHGNRGRTISLKQSNFALRDFGDAEGLKDFSGRATYQTYVELTVDWLRRGKAVIIDLGGVHDMAKVIVNGKNAGVLLANPFTVDITRRLVAGRNSIEIQVFNNPNNAMMDAKMAGMKNLTQKPAGLIGPVVLKLQAL